MQVFRLATTGLEVSELPAWLWTRAIVAGFTGMGRLIEENGGYLIADLDQRTLEYVEVYTPKATS